MAAHAMAALDTMAARMPASAKNLSCQLMSWENLSATARLPRPSRLAWCMLRKSGTGEPVVKGGTAHLGLVFKFGFGSRDSQWTSWWGWVVPRASGRLGGAAVRAARCKPSALRAQGRWPDVRNWDRVSEGFNILRPPLAKFVALELSTAYGDDWWDVGVDPFLTAVERAEFVGCSSNPEWLLECLNVELCLRVIDKNWDQLFCTSLIQTRRPWVLELGAVCENLARARASKVDCFGEDANRWLDTMQRLCSVVDEDSAGERAEKIRALMDATETGAGSTDSFERPMLATTEPVKEKAPADVQVVSASDVAPDESAPPKSATTKSAKASAAPSRAEGETGAVSRFERAVEKKDQTQRTDGLVCYAARPSAGVRARGVFHYPERTLDVLSGSRVDLRVKAYTEEANERRRELIESGALEKGSNDVYTLKQTVTFNSPTGAAVFVLGSATNGWIEWKDDNGKTLKELYQNQDEEKDAKKSTARPYANSSEKAAPAYGAKTGGRGSAARSGAKRVSTSSAEDWDVVTVCSAYSMLGKNCKALYHPSNGRTEVLEGSYVRICENSSLSKRIKEQRAELVSSGDLVARNSETYMLMRNVAFDHPTAAAEFVLGKSASGLLAWKDLNSGATLDDMTQVQKPSSAAKRVAKSTEWRPADAAKRTASASGAKESRKQGSTQAKSTARTRAKRVPTSSTEDRDVVMVYSTSPMLGKNCKAIYHYCNGQMDVLVGSYVQVREYDGLPEPIKEQRKELAKSGDFDASRDCNAYVLRRKISFASSTEAAEFVLGDEASGLQSWRDANGATLGELCRKRSAGLVDKTEPAGGMRSGGREGAGWKKDEEPSSIRDRKSLMVYAADPLLEKTCRAVCHYPSGRTEVLEGSYVQWDVDRSLPKSIKEQRWSLEDSGDLDFLDVTDPRNEWVYVLKKQTSFASPTEAAEFVLGRPASGAEEWKEIQSGVALGELFPELFER